MAAALVSNSLLKAMVDKTEDAELIKLIVLLSITLGCHGCSTGQ